MLFFNAARRCPKALEWNVHSSTCAGWWPRCSSSMLPGAVQKPSSGMSTRAPAPGGGPDALLQCCQALSKSPRVECPLEHLRRVVAQMLFFNAATQYAFTIITFPKTSFLPAFVAGLFLIFSMHKPGMVNLPEPFTSFVATVASFSNNCLQTDPLTSVPSIMAATMPDLDMAAPFMAAAFMAGAFARGAIVRN